MILAEFKPYHLDRDELSQSLLASHALKIVFEYWIILPDFKTIDPPFYIMGNFLPTMREILEDHFVAIRGEILARKSVENILNEKGSTDTTWIAAVDKITESPKDHHPNELKEYLPIKTILNHLGSLKNSWQSFMSLLPTEGEGVYQVRLSI